MSDETLALDEIDLTGIDEYPADESVKLYGPPGTGKTTQSAGRVGRLLRDHGYHIGDVAWCTYRKSLAVETLERLADWELVDVDELKNPKKGPTRFIGTTHAVANRVVGGIGDVATAYHQRDFCKKRNIRWQTRRNWEDSPGQLLFNVFSYMKNNLMDPTNPVHVSAVPSIGDLRDKWGGDVGDAWEDWEGYKRAKDIHDYYEMLEAPVRRDASPGCAILVIDEYHDATPLMAKLSEHWAEKAEIVIIAGDPNQVVNNYAGADPEFFERVELPEILLDRTYRVPYEHWAVASAVLNHAHDPPAVDRVTSGGFYTGTSPMFYHNGETGKWRVPAPDEQYGPVWLVEAYGDDTMFLTRTQKQAEGVARSLERAGVLFKTQASMENVNGWESRSPDDTSARVAVYNALQKLKDFSRADFGNGGLNRWQTSDKDPSRATLSSVETAAILNHANHKHLSQSRDDTTEVAQEIADTETATTLTELREFVEPTFWDAYTQGPGSIRHLNKGGLSDADRDALKNALQRNDGPVGDVDTKVYTIHASKGSEAQNVVLYDGVTGRIQREAEMNPDTLENEWRTWYVALTRASENMIVLDGGFEWVHTWLDDLALLDVARVGREKAATAGVAQ